MALQYKIVRVPDYITDVESYLNTLGSVASGSYQFLHLYNGQAFLVSGSQGTTINVTGSVPVGTVSSSAQINTGSFTGSFNGVHSASTGGYIYNGHSLFNFGQFYDTTTQSGSAGVAYPMKFDTTDISSGVSIVSSSRITVANTGIYNLQFSAQLNNNGGGGAGNTISIWFRVTGSNVPFSTTNVAVINNSPYVVAAWNYASQLSSGSYIEIMWANDNTNLTIPALPTSSVAPAVPSVIATMTQIA